MRKIKEKAFKHTVDLTSAQGETVKIAGKSLVNKVPMGKCPMHVITEGDKLESIAFKEPYNSIQDPFLNIIKDLTSTQDVDIAREIFDRGALAMPKNKSQGSKINITLQALADSSPKDATEARLCLQTTVLYSQGMQYITKAEHAEFLPLKEFYMKSGIKLLRLHIETIEAMNRYRRGGEQRVVVQHVNVNNGGQAIVGNVLNEGGGNKKNDEVIP